MDELIHDFKYHSSRAIARPLAEIIHNILPTVSEPVNIIPLPTIHHHIRERGLDHTLLIAKYLAKLRGKNYRVEKLLLRTKNTVQVGSDRKTRILQAQDAYTINPDIKINPNTTYILFDDVWTTGASMKSAVKLLKKAGAKKIIISLLAVSV